MWLLALLALSALIPAGLTFRDQEIQRDFGVGYAVILADINRDRKPDIVAINPTQAVWFENPTWEKHIIMDGATKKDNVCVAAHDIDGDGFLDLAIGADWQPSNTASGGSLQWIGRARESPDGFWKMFPLGEEPTLHRIRFGDVDGDGKPELVVVPLHGRGNKGPEWEGAGARILVYRIPQNPARDPWTHEVADSSLHIVHNFITVNFDRDPGEEILTASREGIHVLDRDRGGSWSRTLIGEGSPGEIKLGTVGGKRHLATVEPWHGNSIVIYQEQPGKWAREVIESQLQGAHALGWGDFDGDGSDELAVGWRQGKYGVALYGKNAEGKWAKLSQIDDKMATEDLVVGDLDADSRPEIVAVGRATGNVKIYWNQGSKKP